MLRNAICLFALVCTVSALTCFTCDGNSDCANPNQQDCPQQDICYTVTNYQQVIRKGCTTSCNYEVTTEVSGLKCDSCQGDLCNSLPANPIGGGTTFNNGGTPLNNGGNNGIGHGVQPTQSTSFVSVVTAFGTVAMINLL